MFKQFTDRARKVMALANQEAQRSNHEYIGTEHILLSLLKEGSGVGVNVLKNLEVDLCKVRLETEKLLQHGSDTAAMDKRPEGPKAKKVIEHAIEEARNLNHNYIGTEHLLLGLLREKDGVAAQALSNLRVKVEEVREEILNLLGAGLETKEIYMPAGAGTESEEAAVTSGSPIALFLNLILSGSGLILRRREWLGLSMAMIFAICGHVVIAGWLIAPEAVPHWLTRLAVLLGVLTWVLSQYLFYRQGRILARMKQGLANLLSEARRAMENADLASARRALDNGVVLDDEDVELHAMRAWLSAMEGDDRGVQAEWRRVLELDRRGRYRADAEAALRPAAGDAPRADAV